MMTHWQRRSLVGLFAGLMNSLLLLGAFTNVWLALLLGGLVGLSYGLAGQPDRRSYIHGVMTAASLGVPLWIVLSIVGLPLLAGQTPYWTVIGMQTRLPALTAWVLFGTGLGLLTRALSDLVDRWLGPPPTPSLAPLPAPIRIVVVGGGFAGVTTAAQLEGVFGPDRSIDITLVSETNALLFTPMLAEVAGSSLEPTHISTPLRTALRRTTIVRRRVMAVDLARRRLRLAAAAPDTAMAPGDELAFDHLVLAVGSVSNFLGLTNVQRHAFDFKSLTDAIRIRNHVIDCFERAEREIDPARRQALLTIVVAGGGFAGVELVGALNDFARGMLIYFPNILADEVRIMLVHSRDTILPELSESLGHYALERMTERGVTFKLNARVVDAGPSLVVLRPAEEIGCATFIWTAGVTPNPLLKTLGIELDRRGALPVDAHLAVPEQPGLWALGDCAAVSDGLTGQPCPPTAQFALREAKTLAHNIRASLKGQPLKPFHFNALGVLAVVGHQTACAELAFPPGSDRRLRFSGLLAWLMWRGVYLSKLPGLERKVRVMSDWMIELFFPRDIVQTLAIDAQPAGAEDEAAVGRATA